MSQPAAETAQPPDHLWDNQLLRVTQIAVVLERHRSPHRYASWYRRNIMANVRSALDPALDLAALEQLPPTSEGTSTAGLYRQALDIHRPDWADPMTAAEVLAAVRGILDAELAEREWPPEIVPAPPDDEYRYDLLDRSCRYEVTEGGRKLTHVYLRDYYPTARHVVAHIVGQLEGEELEGDELVDFAVWSGDYLVAAAHLRWDRDVEGLLERPMIEQFQVAYFDGDGSDDFVQRDLDPDDEHPPVVASLPGWPTREQWEADGSDRIILRPKGDPAWDRKPNV